MKFRTFLIVAVFFTGIVSITSCTKKYTCHCDIKYRNISGLPDSTTQEYDITDTKSGAKSKCQNESYTHDENGIHTEENCYLY